MATQEEIHDFTRFALDQINSTGSELSMDELYDMWRLENPDPNVCADDVAAINGAIEDYKNGDRGRVAGELSRELRKELGIASDE